MKKLKKILPYVILILIIFNIKTSFAQVGTFQACENIELLYAKYLYKSGANFHTSIKPYSLKQVTNKANFDTIFKYKKTNNKFVDNLLSGNLLVIGGAKKVKGTPFNIGVTYKEKHKAKLIVNPLINIVAGVEKDDGTRPVWEIGGGLLLNADLRKNISINTAITINHAVFQKYLYKGISLSKAVPGLGYAYASGGDSAYSYLNANFMIDWRLSKHFLVETGYGKHFFGDGYRSMILSWNAPAYPYFKLTSDIWKFKYVNLISLYNDSRNITSSAWKDYKYKFSATHYLSLNVGKRITAAFFETVIWDVNFTNGDTRRIFDVHYLNPVIFYRPVEFSLGSPDNVIMGLNAKMTIGQKSVIYGQLVFDEFVLNNIKTDLVAFVKRTMGKNDNLGEYGAWTNKQAYQFGIKHFDLAGVEGLNILLEANAARPYIYSHRRPIKNYSHNGQALAHPLGANFVEGVFALKYNYKRWLFSVQGIAAKTGLDDKNQHNGQDIFKPTYDTYEPEYNNIPVPQLYNVIGQGVKTNIINGNAKISYMVNPVNNLRIEAGANLRNITTEGTTNRSIYVFAGIKTGIEQFYRDF